MSTVSLNLNRIVGALDRRVYGGFVEHLGRCIYGGLFDEGSKLADERGFRKDVLTLLKDLRVRVLRWPGGNFVSNYHWQDGIGPRDERPVRSDLAWDGTETNRFGTDEYIAYCRELDAEPYICFNMGTGDLAEALAWVEYCNGERDTYWANKRRSSGNIDPYGVSWWGLGNEVYGDWQIGSMSADEYIAEAGRWAHALRLMDPNIRLVSCGELGWTLWDQKVIDGLAKDVNLHSIHLYSGSTDYWSNVLAPHNAQRGIDSAKAVLKMAAYNQQLKRVPRLVYDEWNVWYRNMSGALEERFVFSDALAVGTYLNIFVRNCDWVVMANLAQMVNAIAPIVTSPERAAVQPIYYPILLHAQSHLDYAVDTFVTGETIEAPPAGGRWPYSLDDLGPFDLIDVAATTDAARSRVAMTIVNRSQSRDTVKITAGDRRLGGLATIRVVTGSGAEGDLPGLEAADLFEYSETSGADALQIEVPASSFVSVEVGIAR